VAVLLRVIAGKGVNDAGGPRVEKRGGNTRPSMVLAKIAVKNANLMF
jgi:hypothetical protein